MNDSPRPREVANLLTPLPPHATDEHFQPLARGPHTLVERIVSYGQTTPADTWLQQERNEWVLVLRGKARLLLRGEAREVELGPGDAITIPSGQEHRVTMTDPDGPTVWLAVHFEGPLGSV